MYRIVTQSSGNDFKYIENKINDDRGHIIFVTSNEHRLMIIYEIPDKID